MDSINLNKFLDKHKDVFGDRAGTLTGPALDFHFKPGAKPKFCRARPLPYSMLDQYAAQIDEKIKSGFYKVVDHSEWASPTHVVVKNNKLRITGDYKTTLNPNLVIDDFIPRPEKLFAKIRDCTYFCKLDVKDAFMHLRCSQAACEAMTLNTPTHGLIQPAQYGVTNIPAAWQRRLEQILKGIKGAVNFFDDILVFGSSIEEIFAILDKLFQKLRERPVLNSLAKNVNSSSHLLNFLVTCWTEKEFIS